MLLCMPGHLLELANLSILYDEQPVLVDLSFVLDAEQGPGFGITGPSGGGKTSLLKAVVGLRRPHRGKVLLWGESVYDATSEVRLELTRRVGMTFQRSGLFDSMTCEENLRFVLAERTTLSPDDIHTRIQNVLSMVGLDGAEGRFVGEMSGGMQKRLGIARAIALEPELVFYDEPAAGLDPITSREILELIVHVHAERGTPYVIASSDPSVVLPFTNTVGFLEDGHIRFWGSPEDLWRSTAPSILDFLHARSSNP